MQNDLYEQVHRPILAILLFHRNDKTAETHMR